MRFLCSITLVLLLLVAPSSPAQAAPTSDLPQFSAAIAALPGLGKLFAGQPPELGINQGQLSPCPDSPNCVSSQATDEAHAIAPITYQGSPESAREALLKVLSVVPRTRILEQGDRYISTEFETQLMGFVDDGEFYFSPEESLIQVRSAARMGESDLNLNRRRLEQIRLAMAEIGA